MSRSDYLNLNRAYLSNVKQIIKENYGTCIAGIRDSCKVGQEKTTQYEVFQDGPKKHPFDWIAITCNGKKTVNCPDEYRYGADCIIGTWSGCVNGNETRKITPSIGAGKCESNVTSRECGTPCVYEEKPGVCNLKNTITLPCYPLTVHDGKMTTNYVKTKDAMNGGSCNIPVSKETDCKVYGCKGENILKLIIKENYFIGTDDAAAAAKTQSFIDKFIETVNNLNKNEYIFGRNASKKFLTDILTYLESAYTTTYKDNNKVKCQIQQFKKLINSPPLSTSLSNSVIPEAPNSCNF